MATKIVKATNPDIIKLNGSIYRGYYFNPVTNKAYSDMVPGFGPERLYELKPTPTGKYRFRDYTYSTPEIHEVVKSQNPKNYNQIVATVSQPPKARKLPDNLKVRIQNQQEFNQVVAALKKDDRDWRDRQQQWDSKVVGIYAVESHILYSDENREFRNDLSQEFTVNQILEIMNEQLTIKQPEAKPVFKSFKIKCKDWEQAEQIIEKLKAEGYQPVNPKWQAKRDYNVNGIIALPHGTYDWFSYIGVDSTFGNSDAPEITFEEYCAPNVVKWHDLKVGDIVTVDNYPKECNVITVEPTSYEGTYVVKLQNDVKQFWRFKDTVYRLVKRASPVEIQPENKVSETVQVPPSKGWIIGNLNAKSKIEISDNPRIHSTIESVETERHRLMNAHVGETFVILEIKSYGKVETNPVTKIW